MNERLKKQKEFLLEVDKMKQIPDIALVGVSNIDEMIQVLNR